VSKIALTDSVARPPGAERRIPVVLALQKGRLRSGGTWLLPQVGIPRQHWAKIKDDSDTREVMEEIDAEDNKQRSRQRVLNNL
jgi:hypothetical protein